MNTITKEHVFASAKNAFGIVPGVIREMAERSVALAHFYTSGVQTMQGGVFNEIESNAIELRISALNQCKSCIKGHSYLLKKAGIAAEEVQNISTGLPTTDQRVSVLVKAAEYIYHAGSGPFPDIARDFLDQSDLTQQEILEIIGLIALKTISNFTNNYLESLKLTTPL